jgi:RNA polymerase sigma-70 factor, ECF subfamily
MGDQTTSAGVFEEQRALLVAVAYRMLGSVADAEDVVQDVWLRWDRAGWAAIADPRGYLVRMATRGAIDRLRQRAARREAYIGPWLPEPVLTASDVADDVAEAAERAEAISLALLVVLDTLSPLERAVFVLREAFAFSYAEIATILGRGEPAVRQLASRARVHVQERRPRFDADPATRRRVTEGFLAACASGDLTALMGMLASDVTFVSDGGGRAPAAPRPIVGAARVARFLLGIWSGPLPEPRVRIVWLNGDPGLLVTSHEEPFATYVLDLVGDRIQRIYVVANPAKLAGVRAFAEN